MRASNAFRRHPKCLVPLASGTFVAVVALVLVHALGFAGRQPARTYLAYRFGTSGELFARLLWGAAFLTLTVVLTWVLIDSLRAMDAAVRRGQVSSRREAFLLPLVSATLAGGFVAWSPGGGLDVLAEFHRLTPFRSAAVTTFGNGYAAFVLMLLSWALCTNLLPTRDAEQLVQRLRTARRLALDGTVLFVVGLVEVSLLHLWPAALVGRETMGQVVTLALGLALAGGVFFALLAIAFFLPARWLDREALLASCLVENGGRPLGPELEERVLQRFGFGTNLGQRALRGLSVLSPLLSAAPLTALAGSLLTTLVE